MTENKQKLIVRTGERYGVDSDKLFFTLKSTAFKQKDGDISNEQMMALLVVAERYDLNPFVNELYAFPSRGGGIVPVVGVDGWTRIINRHPDFEGMEFAESDETKIMPGAKEAPEWMEVRIYVKGRRAPVVVREYLEEVYRPPTTKDGKTFDGPWQTHTRRMLRHKTIIQGGRVAFGLSGIYDEDEAERVLEAQEQAIEAEIVPEIEDVEGKFNAFLKEANLESNGGLAEYLDETCAVSGLSREALMKNMVVAFTADKKEIGKFVESFRAWQKANTEEDADTQKKKLITSLDALIAQIDDEAAIEKALKKNALELGNLDAGTTFQLERFEEDLNKIIAGQTASQKKLF